MKHYGLIGYPLTHSFSKRYFEEKFTSLSIEATYQNFEIEHLDNLYEVIQQYKIEGFNVTIPFKERILAYLDDVETEAKIIGAVNCVKVKQGKLIGYNTDVIGYEKSLYPFIHPTQPSYSIKQLAPLKALLFGSGGSSKAVQYVLNKLHIPFLLVSRNELQGAITYSDLTKQIFSEYKLLINTTPVGMYPNIEDKLPLPYHLVDKSHFVFDLIYNPEKTAFLTFCEAEGAHIKNGYEMLCIQAEASYDIFCQ